VDPDTHGSAFNLPDPDPGGKKISIKVKNFKFLSAGCSCGTKTSPVAWAAHRISKLQYFIKKKKSFLAQNFLNFWSSKS
jgi:hypothetical protein